MASRSSLQHVVESGETAQNAGHRGRREPDLIKRLWGVLALSLVPITVPVAVPTALPKVRVWSLDARPGPLRAPDPFALVGVTWRGSGEARALVRTTRDGRTWTRWTALEDGHDAPDPAGGEPNRPGTAPLWVGRAAVAEVRFDGAVPRGARVHLVDPGPDMRPLPGARASPVMPGVVSRADWGADESIRRDSPRYAPGLEMAFVHHTATGNAYGPGDTAAVLRSIYAYHVHARGWNDIGYNLLVDRFGRLYEGRAGGLDRPVVGAHALGFNSGSAGIAVIGTFGSAVPPGPAMAALADALAWKLDLHHIDPRGTAIMRSTGGPRHSAGDAASLPAVAGHRDTGETDCPGGALYAALPALREHAAVIGDPKAFEPRASGPVTPNGDGIADRAEASVRFSSPVSWSAEVLDASGRVLHHTGGSGERAVVSWDGRDRSGLPMPHGRYAVRFSGGSERGAVRTLTVPLHVWAWPDGTALRDRDGMWLLEGGALRRVPGPAVLASRMPSREVVVADASVHPAYPRGPDAGFREGTIARAAGRLYLISAGTRMPADASTLARLGFDPASAVEATDDELASHPVGAVVREGASRPSGTVLRGATLPPVWKLTPARLLGSAAVRASHAIRDVDMAGPADAEMAASLPLVPLGFRDGTLLTTAQGRVWVVSNGLRRWITTAERFAAMGYDWGNVRNVSEVEAALHAEGVPL